MRVRPVGDQAVLVELPDLDAVLGLAAAARVALADGELAGATDVVAGYRTLLVSGADPAALATVLRDLEPMPAGAVDGSTVEIPVDYDGADLAEVAKLAGMTEAEVIERHTAPEYRVAFLGFTPGFPYLLGLDPALQVPRRASPRTSVPAGSVGLAGAQTGIYPRPSPGGWQLLGHTDAVLFDAFRDPPALLAPGGRLRFVAAGLTSSAVVPARPALAGDGRSGDVLVRRAGPLTTVQDLGRSGHAHLGVPRAGAVDERSARLANRLVGNLETAAVLEVTLGGLELEFAEPSFVAVCGAGSTVSVNGRGMGEDSAFSVPADGVLTIGPVRAGLRCYLAARGGFGVPEVLGSRSTDTLAGLGAAPLQDGDRLPIARGERAPVYYDIAPTPPLADEVELRIIPGPREEWLHETSRAELFSAAWTVTSTSDRTGLRLEGPVLERSSTDELLSEGLVPGAVQVPANGQPILFLANAPTTGGYPVAGVVLAEDLPLAGQARPGSTLRFRKVPAPQL
jgi:KipI family sensor histidine kinase inhibitor